MKKLLALLAFVLAPSIAFAQGTVLQGGPWQAGHVPQYVGSGSGQAVVMDGGPAGGGAVGVNPSEIGITARGQGTPPFISQGSGPDGTNFCDYDAPTTNAAGYHYLCMSPNVGNAGVIEYGSGGAAAQQPFNFVINGVVYPFPGTGTGDVVGPASAAIDNVATFANTNGRVIKDSGISLGSQAAKLFLATPIGGAGVPTFRAITGADLPGTFTGFANPTALVGPTAVNGSATTAMRSDAAPAFNTALSYTQTGFWSFTNGINLTGIGFVGSSSGIVSVLPQSVAGTPTILWPTQSGTVPTTATSPLIINSTTGNLTCGTCLTTASTGVTAGSYTTTNLTVNAQGQITVAESGSVDNNTALQARASTSASSIWRMGYSTAFDAPALVYKSSSSACSLNSGAGDGGSQVPSSDGKCWLAQFPATGADIREFGCTDLTGATDCSTALQNAENAMLGGIIRFPAGKFLVNTAQNLTNINGLTLEGAGGQLPGNGLVAACPTTGSVILGNTGAEVFDELGSVSVKMNNLSICTIGMTNPSKIGLFLGGSTGTQTGSPGGTDMGLTNVVINMEFTTGGIPIYFVNGNGLSTWNNVIVSGDFGWAIGATNFLSQTPTYGAIFSGSTGGVDALRCYGCTAISNGANNPLIINGSSNQTWDQVFFQLITSSPSTYAGVQTPVLLTDATDIRLKVEADVWPSLIATEGTANNIDVRGTIFSNGTAIQPNVGFIGNFLGTTLLNSTFNVNLVDLPTGSGNFTYTTGLITKFQNNTFIFSSLASSNVAFINSSNFTFNNYFNGNTDSVTIDVELSGVPATSSQYRYFLNGIRQGTL